MLSLEQRQRPSLQLAPQQRQSLKLLAMSLPELRQELVRELETNPVIEDFDHPLETSLSAAETCAEERNESSVAPFPEDEAVPSVNPSEDDLERRERFFDNQVRDETLQEHLAAQIPLSAIPEADHALAEILVGNLNDDGYFNGSLPDIVMVSGETEAHVLDVLSQIRELDPPGCGARNLKECLLAQLDKLEDSPYADDVRAIVESHLDDVAANRREKIEQALGLTREQYAAALRELRTLEPRPGRPWAGGSDATRIVKPEVHVVKDEDGRWTADVDARSTPTIHVSPKYLKMLEDPDCAAETKAYIREKIARVNEIAEAIARREETVRSIAQAIIDAQPGFFENGLKGLKPLTQTEIAKQVGFDPSTVCRTVNDKYMTTPKGVVELRRFFTSGVETADGGIVARDVVADALKKLIAGEDRANPFSDEKLAGLLKEKGFPVARRTVAKYRGQLDIPGRDGRRRNA